MTLIDPLGRELDMGTRVDASPEAAAFAPRFWLIVESQSVLFWMPAKVVFAWNCSL
ncbi:hypothetical protein [Streptomyces cadmiisoli]|uniref:hypothetical protein n=1 Tax=Streptomyces cadmiisoli TaxID=2184053 RepID=UPI003D763838